MLTTVTSLVIMLLLLKVKNSDSVRGVMTENDVDDEDNDDDNRDKDAAGGDDGDDDDGDDVG